MIAEGTDGKDTVHKGWMDDVVTDKAVGWLKGRKDKPFCLFLFFKACHRSWERPARLENLYKDVTVPKPELWDDKGEGKPKAFIEADNKVGGFKDILDYDKFVKDYYATLAGADENVGRVLETLASIGKLDDTMVLHTGDNGFFLGEWQRFDKRFMHEVSIRVPMVVRYPKLIKAGSVSERMVINNDIAPTMLDLAGVAIPKEMQGRPHRGVRTDQWKLIHYYQEPEEYELYDLAADPWEKVNLYGKSEHADRVKQLKARIDELRKESGDTR